MKTQLIKAVSMLMAVFALVFLAGSFSDLFAGQNPSPSGQAKSAEPGTQANAGAQPNVRKELGPAADSIQPYKSAGRDPFRKLVVINKAASVGHVTRQIGFPTLDVRRTQFKQKLAQAHSAGAAEPDPLSQYLVSEVTVIGTFSDDQGAGVFLRAQPSGTTFFVRKGARCYNGEVLRIETDPSDLSSARVVFKETSYTEQDGKQTPTDRVVTKSVGSH